MPKENGHQNQYYQIQNTLPNCENTGHLWLFDHVKLILCSLISIKQNLLIHSLNKNTPFKIYITITFMLLISNQVENDDRLPAI
jgi:hypothetical protein